MTALLAWSALALLAAVLLRLAGVRGIFLAVAGVSLCAGGLLFQAFQGDPKPAMRTSPAAAAAGASRASDRYAFLGRFTSSERWLGMADALAARGNSADAAAVLVAAVKEHPRDYALWIGLGNMLTDHMGGLTPGARFAYARAIALAPAYPAPRYFLGVAEARSGNGPEARRLWAEVLADAPATASWRPLVEKRLARSGSPGR
jgi:Flp pilus assembly protein TadD